MNRRIETQSVGGSPADREVIYDPIQFWARRIDTSIGAQPDLLHLSESSELVHLEDVALRDSPPDAGPEPRPS
jgi:hypothetical protein